MAGPGAALRGWLSRRTTTQASAAIAVLAAALLTGSVVVTGQAVREDQQEEAALAALGDYAAMVSKLGDEAGLTAETLTEADAAYLSAWLSVFQTGPSREARTLEETCRTGRGGAGVRYIRAPVGKPAGLAALGTARATRLSRLGDDVYRVHLAPGQLCAGRAVEVVMVHRRQGALDIIVGRVVDRSGQAWGRAVLLIGLMAALVLMTGLAAALFARRRMAGDLLDVSRVLDRASVGDFSRRAPEVGVAPELAELALQVNRTLDRLEELLTWLRDSSDQLAHDFRTPLARATARLTALAEIPAGPERVALIAAAEADLKQISRAMTEAVALRDGEAWAFEPVRLDDLARAAVELYEPLAEARSVRIEWSGDAISALGVRSLIQRAVANLVDNAVKFSPEGGVVRIAVRGQDGAGVLSVSDQGPGFAATAASPPPDAPESHGMGLSFVRAIMRRHGGAMTIDDTVSGSLVTLRFSR